MQLGILSRVYNAADANNYGVWKFQLSQSDWNKLHYLADTNNTLEIYIKLGQNQYRINSVFYRQTLVNAYNFIWFLNTEPNLFYIKIYFDSRMSPYIQGDKITLNNTDYRINDASFFIIPDNYSGKKLYFKKYQGLNTTSKEIEGIADPGTTAYPPSWLDILSLTFNGGKYILKAMPNATLTNVGTYTADIYLKDSTNQTVDIITVTYVIENCLVNNYFSFRNNFTLKRENIIIRPNGNVYLEINVKTNICPFFTTIPIQEDITFKEIPMNNEVSFDLGKLMHTYMKRFSMPNRSNYQYRFAQAKYLVKEINMNTGEVTEVGISDTISFVAGLEMGYNYEADILDINKKPARVTINSIYCLNLLLESGVDYSYQIFKNNNTTPVFTGIIPNQIFNIYTKYLDFNAFDPGDIVTLKINYIDNSFTYDEKKFLVFPESNFSSTIVWENEFLLQSEFEFTGPYNVSSEFKDITATRYNGYVETQKNLESTAETKLTINTGWISKYDVKTIESLRRSKNIWFLKNNQVINLSFVPNSFKMVNHDTDRERFEFTLEFIINKTYEEESYTF